eukprot:COSAG04_NODE_14669_length_559_cov_8.408696_2_plen_88_part_01
MNYVPTAVHPPQTTPTRHRQRPLLPPMDPATAAARRRVRSLAMALRRSGTAAVEGVVPLAWSITQPVGQTEMEMGPWRIRLMLPAQKQ